MYHRYKSLIYLLVCALTLSSCSTIPIRRFTEGKPKKIFPIPPNPIEKEGWELTFHDEFNDGKLNRTKWLTKAYYGYLDKHHGRYLPDRPWFYFSDTMFAFTDSTILLRSERKDVVINDSVVIPYVGAMLDCSKSFEQQYGYFEIRSKNPASPGYWPAFWLVSQHIYPPEIDIYEFYTSRPRRWTNTIHYQYGRDTKHHMEGKAYKVPDPAEDFNIYAVEWDSLELKFYYNNVLVRTTNTAIETMNVPMHIIINLSMEDPNSKHTKMDKAVFPNTMEIDYVRAYKKKEKKTSF